MKYQEGYKIVHTAQTEDYLDSDQKIEFSLPFVENGTAVSYHDNGNVEFSIEYKNGIRDGVTQYYNEDASIFVRTNYWQGKMNGPSVMINKDDGTLTETLYLDDEVQEENEYYYDPKSGDETQKKLKARVPYRAGVPHGNEINYDIEGNERGSVPWVNGKKHGDAIGKTKNGYIKTIYENGQQIGQMCEYTKEGRLLKAYYSQEDVIITYDAKGRPLRAEGQYAVKEIDHEKGEIREIPRKDVAQAFIWKVEGDITDATALAEQNGKPTLDNTAIYINGVRDPLTKESDRTDSVALQAFTGNCAEMIAPQGSLQNMQPLHLKKQGMRFPEN